MDSYKNNYKINAKVFSKDGKYKLYIDKEDDENNVLDDWSNIRKYVCREKEDDVPIYELALVIHLKHKESTSHKPVDDDKSINYRQDLLITENGNVLKPLIHCIQEYAFFDVKSRIVNDDLQYGRIANIMDSSIWNYCYSEADSDNEETFIRILKNIYENYQLGLYDLGSAYEFADLNARLCNNSYLQGGQHSERVVPFVFHSEFFSHKALNERIGNSDFTFNKKWRFLLLDDRSYIPMSTSENNQSRDGKQINKLEVVIDRLKKNNGVKIIYKNEKNKWEGDCYYNIAIESVTNITDLLKLLFDGNKRRYDIILLDYLLQNEYSYHLFSIFKILFKILEEFKKQEEKGVLNDDDKIKIIEDIIDNQQKNVYDKRLREYISINKQGNKLLLGRNVRSKNSSLIEIELNELEERIEGGIGPDKRLYFMYISSFTQSIQERLQDQLVSSSDKYWFIGKGACPINTPYMFLYNLHVLMEKRVNTILNNTNSSASNIEEFISQMFEEEVAVEKIKSKCRESFPQLLRLRATYENLKNDVPYIKDEIEHDGNGSLLVQSMFDNKYTSSFWEHFQHMCYLICYGNSSQYPEIWEEYLFVKCFLSENISAKIKNYIVEISNK